MTRDPPGMLLVLQPPFSRYRAAGSGYCWKAPLPWPDGDTGAFPIRSLVVVGEDGRPLGPAHALHADIEARGCGRFSHWEGTLFFSTSDNSDPNHNGRRYTAWRPASLTGEQNAFLQGHVVSNWTAIEDYLLRPNGLEPDDLRGKRLLDLGPGMSLATPLLFALLGAEVTAIDLHDVHWEPDWHSHILDCAERLLLERGIEVDRAVLRSLRERGPGPGGPVTTVAGCIEDMPLPAQPWDVTFSVAVLEHVAEMTDALARLAAGTAPGGIGVHVVDFRDHRTLDRPLEFLLMDAAAYERDCGSYRYERGNRLRLSRLQALAQAAGLTTASVMTLQTVDAGYLSDFMSRLRQADTPFRASPRSDLETAMAVVTFLA